MNASEMLGINEIEVGERARTDLGDLTELMESIDDVGLLQPIVITGDRKLIAGGRRLEACRRLGRNRIPVVVAEHITDAVDLLKAEQDENTCRKDMTVSEKLAIAARIEELKRPEAEQRKSDGRELGRASRRGILVSSPARGNQNQASRRDRNQETAALAAEAIGMSRSTYYLVRAVKKYAGDPEQPEEIREAAREALTEMDTTGKFTAAYDDFVAKATDLKLRPKSRPQPQPDVAPRTGLHGKRLPRRSLHRQLGDGLTALSGLCTAFAAIELDDSVNEEEAALWSRDLSESLRVLRSLNTKLKEHSNGNQ